MKAIVWLMAMPLIIAANSAFAQIRIENAWSRVTPPGTTIGVGYMTIHNGSSLADRMVGGHSPKARKVETHVTVREGDITRMRPVAGYDIPANATFELEPGGAHLMLMGLEAPLKAGDRVPLVLKFERAGEVETELRVELLGGSEAAHGHGHR